MLTCTYSLEWIPPFPKILYNATANHGGLWRVKNTFL